jgi:glycosyltransferase involved in cell wall biosynthesis
MAKPNMRTVHTYCDTSRTRISFFYGRDALPTGQTLASELIIDLLSQTIWSFRIIRTPVFEGWGHGVFIHLLRYFRQVVFVWARFFRLASKRDAVIYLNLHQTMAGLVCCGLPFWLIAATSRTVKSVISLHGHVFCFWGDRDIRTRLLLLTLKRASIVTVLGKKERQRLIDIGVSASHVRIVNNTCEFPGREGRMPVQKEHVGVLYLSNLIEAKGYRTYLSGLLRLSRIYHGDTPIRALLCGQFLRSSHEAMESDGTAFIHRTMETINQSKSIHSAWTRGAYGEQKRQLFEEADIFVFPSQYRVEAQPVVLIEAMAAGCAIIASDVGEIPDMIGDGTGICLHDCGPDALVAAILDLVSNADKRMRLRHAALAKYHAEFSRGIYRKNWDSIFSLLCK